MCLGLDELGAAKAHQPDHKDQTSRHMGHRVIMPHQGSTSGGIEADERAETCVANAIQRRLAAWDRVREREVAKSYPPSRIQDAHKLL